MASNQELIRNRYENGAKEDGRAFNSRSSATEFHYTKKHIEEFISKQTRVLEIGCGTGHYAFHFADICKEYVGVDLAPANIEFLKKKIAEKAATNITAMVGDATNLSEIPENSFDLVLCLGPMYHLPSSEREIAFAECKRVCKQGAVAAFAYINKTGAYAGVCVHDEMRQHYPSKKANQLVLGQGTDDIRPNVFFFTMPEEIEKMASKYGFGKIKNLGTDFFVTQSVVNAMDDNKFSLYMELADQMASHESCTGMSNHALLVCRNS